MDYLNPHELLGSVRDVWWNELSIGDPIELELVDYFRAPVVKKGRGIYVIYYCTSLMDYPQAGILKGDNLNFYVSFQCYLNALRKLRHDLILPCCKEHANGKNLYIKLFITSRTRLTVITQEVREPTKAQLTEGHKQYDILREEASLFSREVSP